MIEIKTKCCGTCGDDCVFFHPPFEDPAAPVLGKFKIGAYIQDCYATQSICYNFKSERWEYYERNEGDDFYPKFYNKKLFNLIQRLKGIDKFSDTYPTIPTGLTVAILLFILVRRSGRVD